ncbi:MAG: carbohydrate-binding family 9-like protein [Victivallaceae bacterium]|nr:carbohydrate-binding family 9-like protein [Victivallaceae bacterium]
MKTKAYLWLVLLLGTAGWLSGGTDNVIHARYVSNPPTIDGNLEENAWRAAEWIRLEGSRPAHPSSEEEWEAIYRAAGTQKYAKEQFQQQIRGALLWTSDGLYVGMEAEDRDVVGRMRDGEPLWLEDVLEIFIARRAVAGEAVLEVQISPANAVLVLAPAGVKFSCPRSGAAVKGSLNRHLERDQKWTAELFFSWDELERAGFAKRPLQTGAEEVCAIRLAAWDLSIYSQLRINRFTLPGQANPHFPEFYRRLICDSPQVAQP